MCEKRLRTVALCRRTVNAGTDRTVWMAASRKSQKMVVAARVGAEEVRAVDIAFTSIEGWSGSAHHRERVDSPPEAHSLTLPWRKQHQQSTTVQVRAASPSTEQLKA